MYQFRSWDVAGCCGSTVRREDPSVESVFPLKSPTRTDLAARIGRSPLCTICMAHNFPSEHTMETPLKTVYVEEWLQQHTQTHTRQHDTANTVTDTSCPMICSVGNAC